MFAGLTSLNISNRALARALLYRKEITRSLRLRIRRSSTAAHWSDRVKDNTTNTKQKIMKKNIKKKMSMYRMVIDVLNEYQAVWTDTPKFVEAKNKLENKFALLEIQAEKERSYNLGVKNNRDALKSDIAGLGSRIANALRTLGAETGDLELIAQAHISFSKLNNATHADMGVLLTRIHLLITEHGSALGDYGITQVEMDAFTLKRDEIMANLLAPRKAVVKRSESLMQINALVAEIDEILKYRLDLLVKVLRPQSESLFTEYKAARVVIDYKKASDNNSDSGNTQF